MCTQKKTHTHVKMHTCKHTVSLIITEKLKSVQRGSVADFLYPKKPFSFCLLCFKSGYFLTDSHLYTCTQNHTLTTVVMVGMCDATAEPSLPMSPGRNGGGGLQKRERHIRQQQKQGETEWEGRVTD